MDITKYLNQKAVYWSNPQPDGEGGHTFDDPIEIDCRWTDQVKVLYFSKGLEVVSKSKIIVDRDIAEEEYLYLGTLDSLTQEQKDDPRKLKDAYPIKHTSKIPDFTATTFIRIAYL